MTTTVVGRVVEERIVYTYEPHEWPEGILTGLPNRDGGFALEHVVAFRPGVALAMVRAGIAEAWDRGYRYVLFQIPPGHPHERGLRALAARVKFHEYGPGWFVRYP